MVAEGQAPHPPGAPVNERRFWRTRVTISCAGRRHDIEVTKPVHPRIRIRLEQLGRDGVGAAEARRLVAAVTAELGNSRPSYSTVLRIVNAALAQRAREARRKHEPGALDSLVLGRMPTPRELEGTFGRALEHKEGKREA
jgi:hypothetical protein